MFKKKRQYKIGDRVILTSDRKTKAKVIGYELDNEEAFGYMVKTEAEDENLRYLTVNEDSIVYDYDHKKPEPKQPSFADKVEEFILKGILIGILSIFFLVAFDMSGKGLFGVGMFGLLPSIAPPFFLILVLVWYWGSQEDKD